MYTFGSSKKIWKFQASKYATFLEVCKNEAFHTYVFTPPRPSDSAHFWRERLVSIEHSRHFLVFNWAVERFQHLCRKVAQLWHIPFVQVIQVYTRGPRTTSQSTHSPMSWKQLVQSVHLLHEAHGMPYSLRATTALQVRHW